MFIDTSFMSEPSENVSHETYQSDIFEEIFQEASNGNVSLYHGSLGKYDTLEPFGIDYGNAIEKPGWSLFCWKHKKFAYMWCIHLSLQNVFKDAQLDKNEPLLNPEACKVVLKRDSKDIILEQIRKKEYLFYVYHIQVPSSVVGIGNDSRFDEYTVRIKHIIPTVVDTVKLNEDILSKYVIFAKDEDYNTVKETDFTNNRGLLASLFMTRDYWIEGNSNRKAMEQLQRDYKDGKIKAGDDIESYLSKHHMAFKKISIDRRMEYIVKDPSIVTNAVMNESAFDIEPSTENRSYYFISATNKDDELFEGGYLYKSIITAMMSMKKSGIYYVHKTVDPISPKLIEEENDNYIKYNGTSTLAVVRKARVTVDDTGIQCGYITIYHDDGTVTDVIDEFYKKLKDELNESSQVILETPQLIPVFIITVFTGTVFGKAIKSYLDSTYSHAAIGLSPKLDYLYSFNIKGLNGKPGISVESIQEYQKYNPDSDIAVSAFFLKPKEFNLLKEKLDWFVSHAKETAYDYANIFRIIANKAKDAGDYTSMVCSQFVDTMMKTVGVDITHKPSNLVVPDDLAIVKKKKGKVYKLYEGKISDCTEENIDSKLRYIKSKYLLGEACVPLFEAKEFPIEFNNGGDLLVKNYKKADYFEEYYKSVKLLRMYKNSNNVEGVKYELCRQWFIYQMIESKPNNYPQLRGKILNTLYQYIAYVHESEPNFNLDTYYQDSCFNDNKIIIKKSTLDTISSNMKKLIF